MPSVATGIKAAFARFHAPNAQQEIDIVEKTYKTTANTFEKADAHEMMIEVMKAGETVLREELDLQYDIDPSGLKVCS